MGIHDIDHGVLARLGDDQGGLDDDQLTEFAKQARDIAARYPDPDDRDEMQAALTVAHRLLLEDPDTVIREYGHALDDARHTQVTTMAALRQAAIQIVPARNRFESSFADMAHVDRMTVRSWLGK